MDLRPLLEALDGMEPLVRAAKQLRAREPVLLGAPDAAKPAATALLWRALATPTLLLLPRETDAETVAEQLAAWVGDAAIHLPARGALPYERAESPRETAQRIAALGQLARAAEPWLYGSFAMLVVTGVPQMASTALKQYYSPFFWWKMEALLVGVILTVTVRRWLTSKEEGQLGPVWPKVVGVTSIALWTSVATGARLIGLMG